MGGAQFSGGRSKSGTPMFGPEVFRKQVHRIEESTCDIVWTFRRPRQWFGARRIAPPSLRPWTLALLARHVANTNRPVALSRVASTRVSLWKATKTHWLPWLPTQEKVFLKGKHNKRNVYLWHFARTHKSKYMVDLLSKSLGKNSAFRVRKNLIKILVFYKKLLNFRFNRSILLSCLLPIASDLMWNEIGKFTSPLSNRCAGDRWLKRLCFLQAVFTQTPVRFTIRLMANGSLHTSSKNAITVNHGNPAYLNQF